MEQIKKFVKTERQKLDLETTSKFIEAFAQIVLFSIVASVLLNTYLWLY